VLAGASATLEEIVAYRFLGLCAAALVPLSHHIILDVFRKDRVSFQAVGGMVFGAIVGPTWARAHQHGWRWVFYVNLPMACWRSSRSCSSCPRPSARSTRRLTEPASCRWPYR
jgi:MFS family permease